MSGGRLVVLDRLGREVKAYPLADGLATIGSDPGCDIRVLTPTTSPHHATVVVHSNQTVVSSMAAGETLVNGAAVSMAALRHGDLLDVGGRTLRWEYEQPHRPRPLQALPALARRAARPKVLRRHTGHAREPLAAPQRASLPATSGKQVAIVQPQRRLIEVAQPAAGAGGSRSRGARHSESDVHSPDTDRAQHDISNRQRALATKASLWIESRRAPRTPRPASARRPSEPRARERCTQSAPRPRVTKIQAPSRIDHTKQAALMLMTGHTPKPRQRPSLAVKRPGPAARATPPGATPARARARLIVLGSGDHTTTPKVMRTPSLSVPKKSALKNTSKKSIRKTESIKFDLSNLEAPDRSVTVLTATVADRSPGRVSDEDMSLHYSDSSSSRSPSPRRPIHSRSSRMLETSLGETFTLSERSATKPTSPRARKSSRGSLLVGKALENSFEASNYSGRTTKTLSDDSYSTTVGAARQTRTHSPRNSAASKRNLESYSVVDLVSMNSTESDRSVYGSAGSETSAAHFSTPRPLTRASSSCLGSSTPYVNGTDTSKPASPRHQDGTSASITTPENSQLISINTTKTSRISRSRSRINDSDILLLDDDNDDSSPRSSRRQASMGKSSLASPSPRKTIIISDTPDTTAGGTATLENALSPENRNNSQTSRRQATMNKSSLASLSLRKNISTSDTPESPAGGMATPENAYSPEDPTTPVLSIQHLLEQSSLSQSSLTSQRSQKIRGVANLKRRTIGANLSRTKKSTLSVKSRSLIATSRRSLRAKKISIEKNRLPQDEEEVVTPKSAAKPVHSGVKNKHSSAKKPQSKRSIIDNLNESDLVKQLFNSPVKRKLSQSMTEFSRKKLFDENDYDAPKRPTRNTIALSGRTPDSSFVDRTEAYTPDVFVSPLSTPGNSPNLAGLKRLFDKNTPENDLRNVKGVKPLLRTPRPRRSVKNDLTNVSRIKKLFGRSPRNRMSDVRVKELFATSPANDLRRVSGVKTLYRSTVKQRSPKNALEDVRGVKELFKDNIVLNVSDVSGIGELFHEPQDLDSTFDQLLGKPRVRAYTNSKSFTKLIKKKPKRNAKSLHDSISKITENVEEWIENELKKRVHKDGNETLARNSTGKSNLTRELLKLTTNTIVGSSPLLSSRSRQTTMTRTLEAPDGKKSASEIYSAHTLPIKKRSLVSAANKSGNTSRTANRLPIKKRMIVHSTPVKSRLSLTMNASELGRVSPIPPVIGKKFAVNPHALAEAPEVTDENTATVDNGAVVKRRSQDKVKSPRKTRARARRSSVIITKPLPQLKPNSATNVKIKQHGRTRNANRNDGDTKDTPNDDKNVSEPAISKDSKSKSRKNVGPNTISVDPAKPAITTRRQVASKAEQTTDAVAPARNSRRNKKIDNVTEVPKIKTRQKRLAVEEESSNAAKKTRRGERSKGINIDDGADVVLNNAGKRTKAKDENAKAVKRGKNDLVERVNATDTKTNTRIKKDKKNAVETKSDPIVSEKVAVGRKTKKNAATENKVETTAKRGKKNLAGDAKPIQSENVGRKTRNAQSENNSAIPATKRGKKDLASDQAESIQSENVGRKTRNAQSEKKSEITAKRGKKNVVENKSESTSAENVTVGRKTRNVQAGKTSTAVKRGNKKVVEDKTTTAEIVGTSAGRRRGKKVVEDETSDAPSGSKTEKEARKQTARAAKGAPPVAAVPKRSARRVDTEEPPTKGARRGRSAAPAARKRKAAADAADSEAPVKRQRAAAAPAEPPAKARSRRR